MERSAEAIVAILAVLKTGRRICRSTRAPSARIRFMTEDSARSPRSPPPGWLTGSTAATCWSSMCTTRR